MNLEVTGKLKKKFDTKEVANNFKKREFVLTIEDEKNSKYDQDVCFELLGRNVDQVDTCNEGDTLRVSFNLKGREYNGKYYTNVLAWRIERVKWDREAPTKQEQPKSITQNEEDDLPF